MSDLPIVPVHIFGTEYKIASEADPDRTRCVARYADRKMREVANSLSFGSVAKVAVLTAVNLADELFKEEEAGRRMARTVEETADRLADAMSRFT